MSKTSIRTIVVTLLAAATTMAGCASYEPTDDELAARPQCRHDERLKCNKRSAAPEECSCVSTQDVEELFEGVIGLGIN